MIGVVDESGILEENEVFVQIKTDSFSERSKFQDGQREDFYNSVKIDENQEIFKGEPSQARILTSKLLVTRNPCLNPGDLRLL